MKKLITATIAAIAAATHPIVEIKKSLWQHGRKNCPHDCRVHKPRFCPWLQIQRFPPNNPTNYPIFQRFALKTNEPLNIPTNWPINPTNPNSDKSIWKLHKRKKGRSRKTPRSAWNREKPRNTGVFEKNKSTLILLKSEYFYGAEGGIWIEGVDSNRTFLAKTRANEVIIS